MGSNARRYRRDKNKEDNVVKEKFVEERTTRNKPILPKTEHQQQYMNLLWSKQIICALGSAGSGKSYIPSAIAADMLMQKKLDKVIVCRPYVEMGRTSGLKPGDTFSKLYPMVRPMLDTMKQRMGQGAYELAIKHEVIEIQELATIRGRSFDDKVWIIGDEMQNSLPEEVKSIVTRLGSESKLFLLGDPNQKDIKGQSGLEWIDYIINKYNIPDCGSVHFTSDDIVRSDIVKAFVKAFEKEYAK